MTSRNLLFLSCLVFVVATSCEDQQLDAVGTTYLDLPEQRFRYNNPADTNNAISTLGRVLFYDRQLSLNNSTSCASCHKQSAGFADNVKFSRGFEGRLTSRNSMPIQNLASFSTLFDPRFSSSSFVNTSGSFDRFSGHLFWDGREQSLDQLILQPVSNHIEMGIRDLPSLTEKLSQAPYYASLFKDAFGSEEITPERVSKAVSTFMLAINTNNTRFDQHLQTNSISKPADFPGMTKNNVLTPLELEGMMLFQSKYDCNSCHQVQTTFGYQFAGTFANVGLDATYADPGLATVTNNPADIGKFKIPSLRNVEFTAPYMHDGRFATLDEVVGHYSEGMVNHPNLDTRLAGAGGTAKSMHISEHEKEALIAFLKTLSDRSVLTDEKLSDPFKAY